MERVKPPGALDDAVAVLHQFGGGADDDDAGGGQQLAHLRVEEVVELVQVLGPGDAGGIEDQGGALGVGTSIDELVVTGQQRLDAGGDAAGATQDDRAVQGGLALLVAAQLLPLRNTELACQAGVDDLVEQALVGRQCSDLLVSWMCRRSVIRKRTLRPLEQCMFSFVP